MSPLCVTQYTATPEVEYSFFFFQNQFLFVFWSCRLHNISAINVELWGRVMKSTESYIELKRFQLYNHVVTLYFGLEAPGGIDAQSNAINGNKIQHKRRGPETWRKCSNAFEENSFMKYYVSESKNDFMLLHMYREIMYSMPLDNNTEVGVAVCSMLNRIEHV